MRTSVVDAARPRAALWVVAFALLVGAGFGAVTPASAATAHDPLGNVERTVVVPGGVRLVGWALDPDTASPVYVWVTVDGVGRHIRADLLRPDVGAAFPASGPVHGFDATVPAPPGTHRVCLAASNVGVGAHTDLGCPSVTVLGGSPLGNLEHVSADGSGVTLVGWALDGDTTDVAYVWVTLDGAGRHARADVVRPDVGAAFPGYGSAHGFSTTLVTGAGAHRLCVAVSNVGPGTHTSLGCVDVVAPAAELRSYESEVVRLTNVARAEQGLAALGVSTCAQGQAAARAAALAGATALAHAPLEPVLTDCGAARAGENLARGYWEPTGMVDAWLASSGHRANMLDPRFTGIGVGCVATPSGATLCAQVFLG